MPKEQNLVLKPIGIIHSPYHDRGCAPHQGCAKGRGCRVELFEEFEGGLRDIEGFSHIILIYYLHKAKGYSLMVKTPWDVTPHGLFTTRSPDRPNPLGISVVRLTDRHKNILVVEGLDAIDGTPLLDIKPYVPSIDRRADARAGWLEGKLEAREK